MSVQMKTTSGRQNKTLTETEIDNLVIAEAEVEDAWDKPVIVHKVEKARLTLPPELVARATFLAKVHREPDLEDWLMRIIRERIEIEEVVFLEVKRELAMKTSL
jgi:hypothetical protein